MDQLGHVINSDVSVESAGSLDVKFDFTPRYGSPLTDSDAIFNIYTYFDIIYHRYFLTYCTQLGTESWI